MIVQQRLVTRRISLFGLGQPRSQLGTGQVVKSVLVDLAADGGQLSGFTGGSSGRRLVYLGDSRAQIASYEILEPFELGLYYYEGEICLWVHVTRHFLDPLDLLFDAIIHTLEKSVGGPAVHRWEGY